MFCINGSDPDDVIHKLHEDVSNSAKWFDKNRLSVNIKNLVFFMSKPKHVILNVPMLMLILENEN